MKQVVCEMCGSTDLVKSEGVFVCQTCGCKYSVEEARKMMVEVDGTVEVQGTVKVDNSAFVEKYLQNARRARQKEDWEETEKYYNMVEQNDPQNIEAIFYSSYGKAKQSLVEGDLYKRQAAFKVLCNCVSILDDNFEMDKAESEKKALEEISRDIMAMSLSSYVYNQKKNGYGMVVWTDKMETITLFNNLHKEFMISLEHIAQAFPESNPASKVYYYEFAKKHAEFVIDHCSLANPQSFRNIVSTYNDYIKKYREAANEQKRQEDLKKREEEKQKIAAYWEEHKAEKDALDSEKAALESQLSSINAQISEIKSNNSARVDELRKKRDEKVQEEVEYDRQRDLISDLERQRNACGIFKGKEKKALQERIDQEEAKLSEMKRRAEEAKKAYQEPINREISELNSAPSELSSEAGKLQKRISEINATLSKAGE